MLRRRQGSNSSCGGSLPDSTARSSAITEANQPTERPPLNSYARPVNAHMGTGLAVHLRATSRAQTVKKPRAHEVSLWESVDPGVRGSEHGVWTHL